MSKKTQKVPVHLGGLQDMGKRFVSAWKRAEQGEPGNEAHIAFLDVEAMRAVMSPRRLDLLRYLRQHGAANTRELATAIGSDYKNVLQDVAALEAVGLLLRDGRKLSAPWDEVQASVALVPAA
jgi:predicted transcriptional regulator